MATYNIPYQNISVELPDEGEVFRGPPGHEAMMFVRQGAKFYSMPVKQYPGDLGKIKTYNPTAEGIQMFMRSLGQKGFANGAPNLFLNPKKTTGEVITKSISPINPQGADIKSSLYGYLYKSSSVFENILAAGGTAQQAAEISKGTTGTGTTITPQMKAQITPEPIQQGIQNLPTQNLTTQQKTNNSGGQMTAEQIGAGLDSVKQEALRIQAEINKIDEEANTSQKTNNSGGQMTADQIGAGLDSVRQEALRIQAEINKIDEEANTSQKKDNDSLNGNFNTSGDSTDFNKSYSDAIDFLNDNDSLNGNFNTSGDSTDFNKSYSDAIDFLNDNEEDKPEAPSMVDLFNQQRQQLGVGDLETELSDYDAKLAQLDADYDITVADEEGRLVSMKQIQKRRYPLYKEYLKQKSELETKRARVATQLNNKYNVLETMVNLTGQDYQNASQAYQQKFNNNISLMNLIRGVKQYEKDDIQTEKDNALAISQIYVEMIQSGWTPSTVDKIKIRNIELQAGLPTGYIITIANSSGGKTIKTQWTSDDGTGVNILYDDGTTSFVPFKGGTSGGDNEKDKTDEILQNFRKDLTSYDGEVTREQFARQLQARYPQIDPDDIQKKIYDTYPDNWEG
ncbi:MAG: hypothetical protein K9M15_01610 [Candidatus Marinimicrobia bacterium]|nr:hypothetical protein [Candidatus Neomarinimicrobiota bacterium]